MPYCPIKKRKTVYLDCLECEEKGCRNVNRKTSGTPMKKAKEVLERKDGESNGQAES